MTTKITSATFSACVVGKDGLPDDQLPIVALVGRSNVGKSSLINAITGRKELAKTSSMPGKTLTINFYCINDAFYIVDLPGYGYAKASKVTRARIQAMMNEFFAECKNLKGVIQVLDIRHNPSPLDCQMNEWIKEQKFNFISVLTKADKLSNQQVQKMRSTILKDLRMSFALVFSAKTQTGKEEFIDAAEKIVAGFEFKAPEAKASRRPARPNRTDEARPQNKRRSEGNDSSPRPERPARKPAEPQKTAPQAEPGPNGEIAAQPKRNNNNRNRRWKNKKSGSEVKKDKPES